MCGSDQYTRTLPHLNASFLLFPVAFSRTPRASFTMFQHSITSMNMDQPRGLWLTVGENKIITVRLLNYDIAENQRIFMSLLYSSGA